jgi:hypothetical protein
VVNQVAAREFAEPTPDSLEVLKLAQQLREYHHNSLWEVEKHFTWLFSIILAALATLLAINPSSLPSRSVLLVALSAVGLAITVVAVQVVRREAAFFANAHGVFVSSYNKVFVDAPLEPPSATSRRLALLPFLIFAPWKLSIRDAFQLVFLIFGAAYLGLLLAVVWRAV